MMLVYSPCWSFVIHIPADYPTIQQGIDASVDSDTVLVQPGTYVESINFNGHNIVLGSLFLTTGDTSLIGQTVVDGDSSGSVVILESGENINTIVAGFTIRNSGGFGNAGLECRNNSSPQIYHNIITENNNRGLGGGISCFESSPTIKDNSILLNSAVDGAGIYGENNSNPIIIDNTISGNVLLEAYNGGGGGICFSHSDPIIINNRLYDNVGYYGGGICLFGDSQALIKNNIVANNQSEFGGGILNGAVAIPTIIGNVFCDNIATTGGGYYNYYGKIAFINNVFYNNSADWGGGLFSVSDSMSLIFNCIFWRNVAENGPQIYMYDTAQFVQYNDIDGGWPGEGNIDLDPLFQDPENGGFHLMSIACGDSANSLCIDAGDPNILDSLLDCSWGLGGTRSDMGAYGGGDSLTSSNYDDHIPTPGRFMLFQNYPNPFNASTTIRFILPEPQDVCLIVYDLLGRQVETLLDEYRRAGGHSVNFDASHLSSGVYLCHLKVGDYSETRKMILLN